MIACGKWLSTPDLSATVDAACDSLRAAHGRGADFALLPENAPMMAGEKDIRAQAADEEAHPALAAFRDVAAECRMWLLIGSMAVQAPKGKLANRSVLIDDAGAVVARYDKIHMFDVDLAGGESYRESNTFQSGAGAVLATTPWGPLGMTICYDLRFPGLYRTLAQAGARMMSVPSAFTRPTGKAHWHVLLRARAIETGCFVFAPAQCGTHYGRRKTYGHSLIVDPWGEILADGGDQPGVVMADIDLAGTDEARAMVSSLEHDRPYTAPSASALRPAAE